MTDRLAFFKEKASHLRKQATAQRQCSDLLSEAATTLDKFCLAADAGNSEEVAMQRKQRKRYILALRIWE
jgi:hypothetical protein